MYHNNTRMCALQHQDSLCLDGVHRRVFQQVKDVVVVDLHEGHEHSVAAVLIHNVVDLATLRDPKEIPIIWLLSSE